MKKALICLAMFLAYLGGQAQNPSWALPSNYLKFSTNSTTLPALPSPAFPFGGSIPNASGYPWDGYDQGQIANFASNMMLDRQGNLLFFVVDGFIYDGQGNYIDFLQTGSGQEVTGYGEIAIVPDPGNCDRYYLIAHQVLNFDRFPFVFLLDMSAPNINAPSQVMCNFKGQLIHIGTTGELGLSVKGITPNWAPLINIGGGSTPDVKNSLGLIAVSDVNANNERLAFITNKQGIFRYKIDAAGFHFDNDLIPFPSYGYNQAQVRSEMELVRLSNGHYRIAVPYSPEFVTGIREFLFVAELTSTGALISGTTKYFPIYDHNVAGIDQSAWVKGLEFSATGNRLYVTRHTNTVQPHQMLYYDFNNPTIDLVPFTISGNYDLRFSALELGPNDRLYAAHSNGLLMLPNASSAPSSAMTNFMSFAYQPTYCGYVPSAALTLKMYLLPDQIDGMDYNAFFVSSSECCINSNVFNAEKYVATSGSWMPNTTQNPNLNPLISGVGSDVYIQKELRIPANVQLTITNMTFHFAPGARVVVENGGTGQQGGKLILNNTHFTVDGRCPQEDLWLGVEVWGNTSSSQGNLNNTTQGQLVLNNGSQISHAFIGVLVGKRNTVLTPQEYCDPIETIQAFSFDNTRNGGIVIGVSTLLRDNQRGVYFLPYLPSSNANNLSYFKLSSFIWDAPLKGGYSLQHHAQLTNVKGIRFIGCRLENLAPNSFPYTQLGTGIYAYNAQFHVQSYCSTILAPCAVCPSGIPTRFDHLRYGIRTNSFVGNPLTYTVNRSKFVACEYGIYNQNTSNASISENTFDIRQESYQTAGIVMNRAPYFAIQENSFLGMGLPAGKLSYGLVVKTSGETDKDVYKNTFDLLHIAAQSEGVNAKWIGPNGLPGGNFVMSGLNYTCNDFGQDIELADLTIVDGYIDYFQGYVIGNSSLWGATLSSARNRFSQQGEPMQIAHDIMVSGTGLQALQYAGLTTPHYFADSYTPNWVLSLISGYNGTPAAASPGMCPSKLCNKTLVGLKVTRADLVDALIRFEDELQGLSPRQEEELEAVNMQIQRTREEINLVTSDIVSLLLAEVEELTLIQDELTAIDALAAWNSLVGFLAQDASRATLAPELDEVEEFLPITPTSNPRKTIATATPATTNFELSPNPTQGRVDIRFETSPEAAIEFTVLDMMGKVVMLRSHAAQQTCQLDLAELPNGIYFLLVKSKGGLLGTKKIEVLR